MDDRGAAALADVLAKYYPGIFGGATGIDPRNMSAHLLGEHGRFLPDGAGRPLIEWNEMERENERLRAALASLLVDYNAPPDSITASVVNARRILSPEPER